MGSRHRALLITSGGGEKLHDLEKERHRKELDDFLLAQGVGDKGRGAAQAHFDIGYDDGYSGEYPYFNEDWDEPMSREARGV